MIFWLLSANMLAQGFFLNENTLIRSTEGGYINLKTFDSIMSSNAYTIKVVTNDDRTLKHLQIIPKTDADYQFEKVLKKEKEEIEKGLHFKASDFTAITNKGEKFTLSEHTDKIVFMHFWSKTIEKSYKYIAELNELYGLFKDNKNVCFLSINFDDSLTTEEKETLSSNIDFPIVFNAKEVMEKYGTKIFPLEYFVPKYYLVGKDRWRVFALGYRGANFFEDRINEQLEKLTENE